jgi:hypothetical protein
VPRLSIIIPVVGDLKRLEDTLVSVLENRPDDCQVVVALNRPYDDPYGLSGEVCFVEAPLGGDLVATINAGICAARAPIVHLLTCGAEVGPDWIDAALDCFADPAVAAVAPLVLDKGNPSRVLAAGVQYHPGGAVRRLARDRSPDEVQPQCDAFCGPDLLAAFYRKEALSGVGLFDHTLGGLLSGAEMALSLRQVGLQSVLQPQCRVFADVADDAFLTGFHAEQLFWRWVPEFGWLRSLTRHVLLLAGEGLLSPLRPTMMARLAGRLLGAALMPVHRHSRSSVLPRAPAPPDNSGLPNSGPAMLRTRQFESVGT